MTSTDLVGCLPRADSISRQIIVSLWLLATFGTSSNLAAVASVGTVHEVCQWEDFDAECPPGSVILIDSAEYGRRVRRPGRCIDKAYDQSDCLTDVLSYADRRCSGRRQCQIRLPDANLERSPHFCPRDLRTNLEVSYHCVTVNTLPIGGQTGCDPSLMTLTKPSGFLASVVTDDTGAGSSAACPWTIRAEPGQTIKLTLYDFGIWSPSTESPSSSGAGTSRHRITESLSASCPATYAVVTDKLSPGGGKSLCRGQSRDSVVFQSKGDVINVTMNRYRSETGGDAVYFLIQYDVEGCADISTQPDTVVDRKGDTAVIRCTNGDSSAGREQIVTCVGKSWQGQMSPLLNCTLLAMTTTSESALGGFDFGLFALSRQGLLIIVVVGIALVVSVCIVVIGVICLCRAPMRHRLRSQSNNDLQYVPGMSCGTASGTGTKYDPSRTPCDVGCWNELQPMLQHQQQQQLQQHPSKVFDYPFTDGSGRGLTSLAAGSQHSAERDYATTLQMRRMMNPQHPLQLRPTDLDSCCCTCPVHGLQSLPPQQPFDVHMTHLQPLSSGSSASFHAVEPSAADATMTSGSVTTPTRFSSFRPRVEHIYEVPKFADADDCCNVDEDANRSSTLYNELDTRSFGTVGRRLPASGASSNRSASGGSSRADV